VRALETIELAPTVTFFVGENGSGKSTLLEAMALAADLPTVGSDESRDDATLAPQRALAKHLTLSWTARSKRGFFLRAEDFFGHAKRLSRLKSEMRQEIADIERKFEGRSDYAKGLALAPTPPERRSTRSMKPRPCKSATRISSTST
jgi:predicted ATPase